MQKESLSLLLLCLLLATANFADAGKDNKDHHQNVPKHDPHAKGKAEEHHAGPDAEVSKTIHAELLKVIHEAKEKPEILHNFEMEWLKHHEAEEKKKKAAEEGGKKKKGKAKGKGGGEEKPDLTIRGLIRGLTLKNVKAGVHHAAHKMDEKRLKKLIFSELRKLEKKKDHGETFEKEINQLGEKVKAAKKKGGKAGEGWPKVDAQPKIHLSSSHPNTLNIGGSSKRAKNDHLKDIKDIDTSGKFLPKLNTSTKVKGTSPLSSPTRNSPHSGRGTPKSPLSHSLGTGSPKSDGKSPHARQSGIESPVNYHHGFGIASDFEHSEHSSPPAARGAIAEHHGPPSELPFILPDHNPIQTPSTGEDFVPEGGDFTDPESVHFKRHFVEPENVQRNLEGDFEGANDVDDPVVRNLEGDFDEVANENAERKEKSAGTSFDEQKAENREENNVDVGFGKEMEVPEDEVRRPKDELMGTEEGGNDDDWVDVGAEMDGEKKKEGGKKEGEEQNV